MELKSFLPPIVKEIYKRYIDKYGWHGDYLSWNDAKKETTGYDAEVILNSCKESLLKVKNGKAIGERDSVLFDSITYSNIVLAGIALAKKDNSLKIIDFGGSLGSSYFQNKKIIDEIKKVKWCVVEQKNFVNCGKKYFEDGKLTFEESISIAKKRINSDTILLSGVLQYIEHPYELMEEIIFNKFKFIIIDRTPFILEKDKITIQKVNPKIYPASYPCWFFNEEKMKNFFTKRGYILLMEDESLDKSYKIKSKFKGMIFKKNEEI